MAYTKNPTLDTYETKRFPFVGSHNARDYSGSKDQRYVNCYPESIANPLNQGKRVYLIKRPGLVTQINPGNAATARGLVYWNSKVYSVFGDKVYSNTTQIATLSTSTGTCGFVACNGDVDQLFLCDGTNGYVISTADVVTQINQTYSAWTGTTTLAVGARRIPTVANSLWYEVTAITTGITAAGEPTWPTTVGNTVVDGGVTWTCKGYYGGFPSPHIPTPVFANGYVFLPLSNTDRIFNSDIDNHQSWNPINYISAEMFPDHIVGLAKQNNQIVAFGENSTEFFYDAANVNTSPLARNDAAGQQLGCAAYNTIVSYEQSMIFVGQSELGGRCVWLIKAFQPDRISIEWVDDALDHESSSISNANAYLVRVRGHQFYVLNLTNRTVVYDIDEKMWHEWSSNNSGSHQTFKCNFSCDYTGEALVQHATNGKIYKLDPYTYTDDGTAILMEAVTSLVDLDINDRKACRSVVILGDRTSATAPATLYYSDDDYQTWSAGRALDFVRRPFLMNLGIFRRRAFKLTFQQNFPLRIEALEFVFNKHST